MGWQKHNLLVFAAFVSMHVSDYIDLASCMSCCDLSVTGDSFYSFGMA